MSKPALCVCEIKGADQLDHNRAADQGFCFCYIDMLPKYNPPTSKVRNLKPLTMFCGCMYSMVCVRNSKKTGFLATQHIFTGQAS